MPVGGLVVASKAPLWTFELAQPFIAGLQVSAKQLGYHIALGGGVLNNLKSDKDLDLYFLPMQNGEESDPESLLRVLEEAWSKLQPFSNNDAYSKMDDGIWTFKGKIICQGRRIDIWIM